MAIGLAAVAGIAVIAAMPANKQQTKPQDAPPVNVAVQAVVAEPSFPDTFDLPAVVEPNRVVKISAEVAGRIVKIVPSKGSRVRAGDLLIQLDEDLVRPRFDVAQAQAQRDQIEFDRMADLVKKDATSRKDLDDATTRMAISKAQLAEIRATLDRARILSPTSGVLNSRLVEEGEYVQPGTPVAEVVDADTVKVVVDVPERDAPFFAVGQKALAILDTKGQTQPLEGTITFISEVAHPQTRSTRMEISLPNREGLLRSGQIVRARLTRQVLKDVVMIPLLAVIPMEEGKAAYVVDPNTLAQRRRVELGILKGDRVQVTRGLHAGDRLIVAGHRFVAPGQKVQIVSADKVTP